MHLPPPTTNLHKRKAGAFREAETGSDDEALPPPAKFPAIEVPERDDECFGGFNPDTACVLRPPGRPLGNGDIAQGLFPRQSWHFLLALLNPGVHSYEDFQRVTGTTRAAAGCFGKQVRKLGAALNSVDLPVLDTNHPAVRSALRDIHRTLVPLATRSPAPARPQRPRDGARSLLRFLHMQPRHEWFTTEELERHFDHGGRKYWMLCCMRSYTEQGTVEVRDMNEKPRRYRIDLRYRDALAMAARHVPWRELLPARPEPPLCDAPSTTSPGNMSFDGFAEHLRSRGLGDGRPATPAAALDFLAARGIAGRPVDPPPPAGRAAELLHMLAERHGERAIICLPGDPRHVEAWREASGFWRARHLADTPAGTQGKALWLHELLAGCDSGQDAGPVRAVVFDA